MSEHDEGGAPPPRESGPYIVDPLPPSSRPDSTWDDRDPQERVESLEEDNRKLHARLDAVYTRRRQIGYCTIGVAFLAAAALVAVTICQMPTLDKAWSTEKPNTDALLLLAIAHVGVTVAAVVLLSRLMAIGERLALPPALVRHADRLLGRGNGAPLNTRTIRELADLIGRMNGGKGE